MGSMSVYLVAVLQMVSGVTLQFVSMPEESHTLYRAPAPYRQPDKTQLSSIILTKPLLRRSSSVDEGRSWEKELYVSTTLGPGESASTTEIIEASANAPYRYSINCNGETSCSESFNVEQSTTQPTFKPYSQEELDVFLKKFAATSQAKPTTTELPTNKLANLYINEPVNVLEAIPQSEETQVKDESKSSSWHHQHAQQSQHQHPYDDHTGWVSLEPIPWSSSSIQKWEPNPHTRPQIPPWDSKPDHHHSSSHWDSKPPQHWSERPWGKPTYEYKPLSKPQHWNTHQEHHHKPSHWYHHEGETPSSHYPEIITDGLPGHFPSSHDHHKPWDQRRPPFTQVVYHGNKEDQNGEGDGQWVLLSSTKGYSVPQRHRGFHQRAITFSANGPVTSSVSSHRTVRLTVLPALNGTTNTTTAHGGLLEVEETFQTVDEAQREHAAKMLKHKEEKVGNSTKKEPKAERRSITTLKVMASPQQDISSARRSAVLAAVGAGMIPATVAMLLPMMLGRKKRSAKDTSDLDDVYV